MSENKRIQYIDTAKFLGLLLVVFIHGYKEGVVTAFAYSFHMPLFFFLNGMTFKPDNISLGDFLVKKIKGYLIPAMSLGILCSVFDIIYKSMTNVDWDLAFFLNNVCRAINQIRFFPIWFLTALFFSDIFLFAIYHKCKKNIWLTGLGVFALLGFGILYNSHTRNPMVWNVDVAFFGTIFTYFGFLFTSKNLSFIYQPIISRRWISLIVGTALMAATFALSLYIQENTTMINHHMEMFASHYGEYYLTLPCALLGALGFTILCRGLTNFAFAYMVKYNLILLAIHQAFSFTMFRLIIAKDWWNRVASYPPENFYFIRFTLAMLGFSLVTGVVLYYIIIITPFSFILNKPRYPLFEKAFGKIIRLVRK